MSGKPFRVIFGTLLIYALASNALAQNNRDEKNPTPPCPDRQTYTGKYTNLRYGFSIVIPAGLKGYWNSAVCVPDDDGCICMQDHGRTIRLADNAYIEAYTGYEIPEWSPVDYEKSALKELQRRAGVEKVEVLSSRSVRLDKLRARRFAFRFAEKRRSFVLEHVVAVHNGVEYQLILSTSAERYTKDRRKFEEVRTSWRLIPRS